MSPEASGSGSGGILIYAAIGVVFGGLLLFGDAADTRLFILLFFIPLHVLIVTYIHTHKLVEDRF